MGGMKQGEWSVDTWCAFELCPLWGPVCIAGADGCMCVVLGENGVFRIPDPLV
jgi:hypothetical protein